MKKLSLKRGAPNFELPRCKHMTVIFALETNPLSCSSLSQVQATGNFRVELSGQVNNHGSISRKGNSFYFLKSMQTNSGTDPASYLIENRDPFPRDKVARHEADHPCPLSAKVKNEYSSTSTPPHAFAVCKCIFYQEY
jgi:hypothetical protein